MLEEGRDPIRRHAAADSLPTLEVSSGEGSDSATHDDDDLNDDEIDAFMFEMDAMRAELALSEGARTEDFRTVPQTKAAARRAGSDEVHSIQGICCSVAASSFVEVQSAKAYAERITKSQEFTLARYGSSIAGILARGWVHRMQYFLDISFVKGEAADFSTQEVADYVEPRELTDLAAETSDPHVQQRVRRLRRFFAA